MTDHDEDDDVFLAEDDFDEPDAVCADCGDDCFAEDWHFVEAFERFGAILCDGCFQERCEDDAASEDAGDPDMGAEL
jgi:hypothetical protein